MSELLLEPADDIIEEIEEKIEEEISTKGEHTVDNSWHVLRQ
jgi:hypothetical protein